MAERSGQQRETTASTRSGGRELVRESFREHPAPRLPGSRSEPPPANARRRRAGRCASFRRFDGDYSGFVGAESNLDVRWARNAICVLDAHSQLAAAVGEPTAGGQTRFELAVGAQYGLRQEPAFVPGWVVAGGFEIDGREFVVEPPGIGS